MLPRPNLTRSAPLSTAKVWVFNNKTSLSPWLESCFSLSATSQWRHSLRSSQKEGIGSLDPANHSLHMNKHHTNWPHSPAGGHDQETPLCKGKLPQIPISGGFLLHCHGWPGGLGCQGLSFWKRVHKSISTTNSQHTAVELASYFLAFATTALKSFSPHLVYKISSKKHHVLDCWQKASRSDADHYLYRPHTKEL